MAAIPMTLRDHKITFAVWNISNSHISGNVTCTIYLFTYCKPFVIFFRTALQQLTRWCGPSAITELLVQLVAALCSWWFR